MSLKGFHIIFIILAFLCTAGFWGWSVVFAERAQDLGVTSMANFSASLAIGLLVYGVWFVVRKSKSIHVV